MDRKGHWKGGGRTVIHGNSVDVFYANGSVVHPKRNNLSALSVLGSVYGRKDDCCIDSQQEEFVQPNVLTINLL